MTDQPISDTQAVKMIERLPKGRWNEIRAMSKEYVDTQLKTMQEFGSKPELSKEEYNQLTFDCAKPVLLAEVLKKGGR